MSQDSRRPDTVAITVVVRARKVVRIVRRARRWRLTVYRDRRQEWRWNLTVANGHQVAECGEGYQRRVRCEAMARVLFPWFWE